MKHPLFTIIVMISLAFSSNSLWADSMPKMEDTVICAKKADAEENTSIQMLREEMQQQLKIYNEARFQMSNVLRAMVIDYSLQGYSKKRLLSYAEHFEEMNKNIPNLDPNTAEYKNFDFLLGMSFASTVIFLNTTKDVSKHFLSDQQDPKSNISQYVVKMDIEEALYTKLLNNFRKKEVERCS